MAFQTRIVGPLESPRIEVSGEERKLIEPDDYDKIGLNMEALLSRIEQGWGGGRPKAIYLRNNQLPWGDQSYGKYGLTECFIRRRVASARILSDEVTPYTALGIPSRNNSHRKAKVGVSTALEVTHSMSTSWSADVRASASTTVTVEAGGEAYGGKLSVSQTLSVEAGYGQGGSDEKTESVTNSASVEVELPPFTGAQAKLVASRGKILAQVEYVLDFGGHIWVDYGRRQKLAGRGSNPNGHFFYFDPLTSHVFGGATSIQTISIDRFANYNVDIEDIVIEHPDDGHGDLN